VRVVQPAASSPLHTIPVEAVVEAEIAQQYQFVDEAGNPIQLLVNQPPPPPPVLGKGYFETLTNSKLFVGPLLFLSVCGLLFWLILQLLKLFFLAILIFL
jgi:hypothetical protein